MSNDRWRMQPRTVITGVDDDGEDIVERRGLDATTYERDLDWYWGVYSAACGLRSAGEVERVGDGTQQIAKTCDDRSNAIKVKAGHAICSNPDIYTDAHVAAFALGRAVWRRLSQLPASVRDVLRLVYEPRQYFPAELVLPSEDEVRLAHIAYRSVALGMHVMPLPQRVLE